MHWFTRVIRWRLSCIQMYFERLCRVWTDRYNHIYLEKQRCAAVWSGNTEARKEIYVVVVLLNVVLVETSVQSEQQRQEAGEGRANEKRPSDAKKNARNRAVTSRRKHKKKVPTPLTFYFFSGLCRCRCVESDARLHLLLPVWFLLSELSLHHSLVSTQKLVPVESGV